MIVKNPLIRTVALAAFTLPVTAAPVAYEPFDYAPASELIGQDGGSGWTQAWRHRDASPGVSPLILASSLSYTDAAGASLITSGGSLDTKNGTTTSIAFRELPLRLTETWISFLLMPTASGDFVGLTVYDSGDNNADSSRFGVEQRNVGVRSVRLVNSEPAPAAAKLAPVYTPLAGETIFVAIRMIPNGEADGQDRLEVYYNPLLGTTPIAPHSTLPISPGGFDRVRIAATNGRSAGFDEIRIGDSYADVAPFEVVAEVAGPDGLTPSQRATLGLDPTVPHTALADAIRANPEFLGLFNREQFLNQPGALVMEAPASGAVPFSFRIRTSTDLKQWTPLQTITRPTTLPSGKSFFRVTFGNR